MTGLSTSFSPLIRISLKSMRRCCGLPHLAHLRSVVIHFSGCWQRASCQVGPKTCLLPSELRIRGAIRTIFRFAFRGAFKTSFRTALRSAIGNFDCANKISTKKWCSSWKCVAVQKKLKSSTCICRNCAAVGPINRLCSGFSKTFSFYLQLEFDNKSLTICSGLP